MNQQHLEAAVLGALLLSKSAWDRGGYRLTADDFVNEHNRDTFSAIRELVADDVTPDAITVCERMQSRGVLPDGGEAIARMVHDTPSAAGIDGYVEMLLDRTLQRGIQRAASRMMAMEGTGREQLIQAGELLSRLDRGRSQGAVSLGDCIEGWMEEMQARSEAAKGGGVMGVPTGFCDVDKRLGGLRPGELIVLAGRPGMGKSAFAMNVALHACEVGSVALYQNLEMGEHEIPDRLVSCMTGAQYGSVRRGGDDDDWRRITPMLPRLRELPLFLDHSPDVTPQAIHARARQMQRQHGLDLLMIDHLQLVRCDGRHTTQNDRMGEVSREAKKIAKSLGVAVLLLSQLNRDCEKRPDKRPLLSDLRDSGSIEQDADTVGFLYRDEIYHENTERVGLCELLWRKVRNGVPGADYFWFDGQTQRFSQADRDSVPQATVTKLSRPYSDGYKRSGT